MSDEPDENSERIQHYLAKAQESLELAGLAHDPRARADFIRLAASWRALAAQIEKTLPN